MGQARRVARWHSDYLALSLILPIPKPKSKQRKGIVLGVLAQVFLAVFIPAARTQKQLCPSTEKSIFKI